MSGLNTTCWTVIREAAEGHPNAREEFARTYLSAVRTYLKARWSNPLMRGYIDDATQEVFLECFRDSSPLKRVWQRRYEQLPRVPIWIGSKYCP